MIAGDGFALGDTVVYQRLTDTTLPLVHPAAVPTSSTADRGIAPVVSFENVPDSLTIRLPTVITKGASYALWVINAAQEWSVGVKINDARPLWITPDVTYRMASPPGLSRQIKIVGRNLQPEQGFATKVRLRGPKTYTLTAIDDENPRTALEHYAARVELPHTLKTGTYEIDVRRNGSNWIPLADQKLTVLPDPEPLPRFYVASRGCAANDGVDDTPCFVDAINAAAFAGGGVVVLGPGRWDLLNPNTPGVDFLHGIVLPVGVSLTGSGASLTTVFKGAHWNEFNGELVYRAVFTIEGESIIDRIRFEDARSYHSADWTAPFFQLGKLPWPANPDPIVVDDVTFTENVFARPFIAIADGGAPIRHLRVTHNEFGAYHDAILLGGNRYLTNFKFRVDDSIVSDNVFKPGGYVDPCIYQGAIATHFGAAYHLDFSDNFADGRSSEYLAGATPGWRAGFFWHMNNNQEMVLVSRNTATCTGDKAGDGEAFAYDNNANTFGFKVAKSVVQSDSAVVKVSTADGYPLEIFQNGQLVPADYYREHWIQVVNGVGLGQARKIVSYVVDPLEQEVTFTVSPAWDVVPRAGSSMITVAREFWQVYTVDNTVDTRGCAGYGNRNGLKRYGGIGFGAMTADSTAEGNAQYDTAGIMISPGYSVESEYNYPAWQRFAYFLDVRGNELAGEPDYDSACSWAGVSLWHGAVSGPPENMPPSPAVLGYGVSIAKNSISHSDSIRGGAIAFADTWFEPNGSRMYVNTLIYGNEISNLPPPTSPTVASMSACSGSFDCGDNPIRQVGIHIKMPLIHATVLSDNTFTQVFTPLIDNGVRTVQVF